MNDFLVRALPAFVCLLPFLIIVMQGPSLSGTLILGSALPLFALFRLGTTEHWKTMLIMGAAIFPYAFLAWFMPDQNNELKAHYTIFSLLYGIPAGMYFACLAHAKDETPVRTTLLAFCLLMTLVGLYVSRVVGTDEFVRVTGEGFERENLNDRVNYLGFFYTEDLNIGIIPFTIFALAASIAVIHLTSPLTLGLVLIAAAIAAYVNFTVLTRTAIVCAGVAILVSVIVNPPERRADVLKRAGIFAAIAVVAGIVFFLVPARRMHEEVALRAQAMSERVTEAEKDGRIDHWKEAAGLITRFPGGESRGGMQTHIWAHNVFLDTGLSTGVIGMLSIAAALLVPVSRLFAVIRAGRMRSSPLFHILSCQFIAVLFAMQISPPNMPYLAFTAFFTGYVFSLPRQ